MRIFLVLSIIIVVITQDEKSIEDLVNEKLPDITSKITELMSSQTPVKDQLMNSISGTLELLYNNADFNNTLEYQQKLEAIMAKVNDFNITNNIDDVLAIANQFSTMKDTLSEEAQQSFGTTIEFLKNMITFIKASRLDINIPYNISPSTTGNPDSNGNTNPPLVICASNQCVKDNKCVDKNECDDTESSSYLYYTIILAVLLLIIGGGVYLYRKKRVTNGQVEYMPQVNIREAY
jgi:hypothetical protein